MKLTKHELMLAAKFLEQAADYLGNEGCNDYKMENTDENWAMLQAAEEWNNTPTAHRDERPPAGKMIWTQDFFIAGYLAHRLGEEGRE